MALVDNLFAKNTNKQFITVESKNGQLFYIVIDYDAVQNEETDSYAVHFLNMVDEADLTALLEELDIDVPDTTPESTPTPKPTVEVVPEPDEPNGVNSSILLIVFALLVGGVILYYFKVIKKKPKQKVPSYTDEYDMDDDDIWEKEVLPGSPTVPFSGWCSDPRQENRSRRFSLCCLQSRITTIANNRIKRMKSEIQYRRKMGNPP